MYSQFSSLYGTIILSERCSLRDADHGLTGFCTEPLYTPAASLNCKVECHGTLASDIHFKRKLSALPRNILYLSLIQSCILSLDIV